MTFSPLAPLPVKVARAFIAEGTGQAFKKKSDNDGEDGNDTDDDKHAALSSSS